MRPGGDARPLRGARCRQSTLSTGRRVGEQVGGDRRPQTPGPSGGLRAVPSARGPEEGWGPAGWSELAEASGVTGRGWGRGRRWPEESPSDGGVADSPGTLMPLFCRLWGRQVWTPGCVHVRPCPVPPPRTVGPGQGAGIGGGSCGLQAQLLQPEDWGGGWKDRHQAGWGHGQVRSSVQRAEGASGDPGAGPGDEGAREMLGVGATPPTGPVQGSARGCCRVLHQSPHC